MLIALLNSTIITIIAADAAIAATVSPAATDVTDTVAESEVMVEPDGVADVEEPALPLAGVVDPVDLLFVVLAAPAGTVLDVPDAFVVPAFVDPLPFVVDPVDPVPLVVDPVAFVVVPEPAVVNPVPDVVEPVPVVVEEIVVVVAVVVVEVVDVVVVQDEGDGVWKLLREKLQKPRLPAMSSPLIVSCWWQQSESIVTICPLVTKEALLPAPTVKAW